MSVREPPRTPIPTALLLLVAMLLIATVYSVNPVHRRSHVTSQEYLPASAGRIEWRDR